MLPSGNDSGALRRLAGPISATLGAARRSLGSVRVLMSSGLHRTSAGDLSAKVFRKHAPKIRGYLTIRLRDPRLAARAYRDVWEELEHSRLSEVHKAPSRVSHLYLLARSIADYARLFDDEYVDRPLDAVPWEAAPAGAPPGYGAVLDELRHGVSELELELLELAHVHGLTPAGMGHVLGMRTEDIERKLEAATAWVRMISEDALGSSHDLEQVVRDAFRVLPPPADEVDPVEQRVPPPLPPGTVVGDRYTLEAKVGGGAFGWVYRATDVKVPGHVVALKMLHKAARTQIAREGAIRELSLIASAFHPSLVHFKEHGWWEERLWFVMPWYEGETLEQRIAREPLSLDEALRIFEPAARALAALHDAGVRHQDIKPDNIYLARIRTGLGLAGTEVLPVVLDLGVAAPVGDMAVAGTPMYFAPEVAARFVDADSARPVTDKSDVFALALSLVHSLCPPREDVLAGRDFETFLRERAARGPELPDASALAGLGDRVSRWLDLDAARRPSAGELADELADLFSRSHAWVERDDPVVPPVRRRAFPLVPAFLSLLGLSSLGGAMAYGATLPVDPSHTPLVDALIASVEAPAAPAPTSEPAPTPAPARSLPEREVRVLEVQLEAARERAERLEAELSDLRGAALLGAAPAAEREAEPPAADPEP